MTSSGSAGANAPRRWPSTSASPSSSSASARPSTASTVQSFASASPSLVAPSTTAPASSSDEQTETETEDAHTDTEARRRRSQRSPATAAVNTATTTTTTQTPTKIGKSFESLLASNETWVLKETAQVAESNTATPTRVPPSSSSSSNSTNNRTVANPHAPTTPTPHVISRKPKYLQDSTDDEDAASASAPTPTPELTPFSTPVVGSTAPRQSVPAYPKAAPAPAPPLAPPRTTMASPQSSVDASFDSAFSTASTLQPAPTFRERFKRTSTFLKRFKGGGGNNNNVGVGTPYNKQSAASTVSLHHSSTRTNKAALDRQDDTAGGHSSSAQSVPNSPSRKTIKVSPTPQVPEIPAQYAALAVPPPSSRTSRSSSLPPPADRSPATVTATAPMPPPKAQAPAAPATVPRSVSAGHRAGQDSKSSLTTSGSGAELRSKLQAWENSLDDAFKESARDLDQKTKFTSQATWGPSPRLPDLGLGIALGDGDDGSQPARQPSSAALFPAASPPRRTASLTVDESQRSRGPSSAPATPLVASPVSRRLHSSDGTREQVPQPLARPWQKSSSAYLDSDRADADVTVNASSQRKRTPQALDLNQQPRMSASLDSQQQQQQQRQQGQHRHPRLSQEASSSTVATAGPSPTTPSSTMTHAGKKARDSAASGTSCVSFETAADGSSSGDRTTATTADHHAFDDADEGDEDEQDDDDPASLPPHLRPENSIRLISQSVSSSDGMALSDVRNSGLASISEGGRDSHAATPKARHDGTPTLHSARPLRTRPVSVATASTQSTSSGMVADARRLAPTTAHSHSPLGTSASSLSDFNKTNAVAAAVHRAHDAAAAAEDEGVLAPDDAADQDKARELADKCWNEDETWLKKERIAEWLGGLGPLNHAARTHYFAKFDFAGMRVDAALRHLCDKLFLRAETQQVDRVLAAFSQRWYQCNPSPVYADADIVHAVVFSLLLLNTDLHVADISERMTRQQFVRNTISAIVESAGDANSVSAAATPPANASRRSSIGSVSLMGAGGGAAGASTTSLRRGLAAPATVGAGPSARPGLNRGSSNGSVGINGTSSTDTASTGTALPVHTAELESLLKEMYNAVKADRIRLPNAQDVGSEFSAGGPNARRLGRNTLGPPSALNNGSNASLNRVSQLKRGSIRGLQGLLGANNAVRSEESISPGSQTSSIGSRSMADSGWLANLHSSPGSSMTSVGSQSTTSGGAMTGGPAVVQPASLGFASTLAQNIIKEAAHEHDDGGNGVATTDSARHHARAVSLDSTTEDVDDDDLALIGAPWAKEGVLSRKHYWEAPQRRAKDKNWAEVFVVVGRGTLSMFKFGESGGSGGGAGGASGVKDSPLAGASTAVFGGGNWLSNASRLGDVPLAHTLANALPPPGYNRARPHVFALTLPSGAVYFFQAGTEDLVSEWVSTCNYWAARTSRQPFAGGVSNMEYGWNKVLPRLEDESEEDGNAEDDQYSAQWAGDDGDEAREEVGSLASRSPKGGKRRPLPSSLSSGSHGLDESIYGGAGRQANPDTRSVRSGRSGRSFGSRAGAHLYQSWQDAAHTLGGNTIGSHGYSSGRSKAPSISGASLASTRKKAFGSIGSSGGANTSSNERLHINEWKAPLPPTMSSTLGEEAQMESCVSYIAQIESDLTAHNELRTPMLSLYSPRGSNYNKALGNWERKSNYLLGELVKWQGYVESLNSAMRLRGERRDMKTMEVALKRADEEMDRLARGDGGDDDEEGGSRGPVVV